MLHKNFYITILTLTTFSASTPCFCMFKQVFSKAFSGVKEFSFVQKQICKSNFSKQFYKQFIYNQFSIEKNFGQFDKIDPIILLINKKIKPEKITQIKIEKTSINPQNLYSSALNHCFESYDLRLFISLIEDKLIKFEDWTEPCFFPHTPLTLACKNNNAKHVKFLLEETDAKNSVNTENAAKKLPIDYACENGNPEIVKLLMQHKSTFKLKVLEKINNNGQIKVLDAIAQNCELLDSYIIETAKDYNLFMDLFYESIKNALPNTVKFLLILWANMDKNSFIDLLDANEAYLEMETKNKIYKNAENRMRIRQFFKLKLEYDKPGTPYFDMNLIGQDGQYFDFFKSLQQTRGKSNFKKPKLL